VCLCECVPIYLSIYLSIYLYLFIYLHVFVSICLCVCVCEVLPCPPSCLVPILLCRYFSQILRHLQSFSLFMKHLSPCDLPSSAIFQSCVRLAPHFPVSSPSFLDVCETRSGALRPESAHTHVDGPHSLLILSIGRKPVFSCLPLDEDVELSALPAPCLPGHHHASHLDDNG